MRPQKQQRICVILLLAGLCFFSLQSARANVIHVPAVQPTIQAAINAAANGDTVLVAPGTYKENINFMGKAITVTSSSGAQVTIIDGGGTGPVVTFSTGEGLMSVLSGFTIQNGFANFDGGGIFISGASPTITTNIIFNNSSCSGGGIAVEFGSPLIKANIVSNNFQAGCGGGTDGGGILIQGLGSAQIVGNVIDHNVIGFQGGGIGMFVAGTPTIRSNIIVGNTASNSGGGIGMVNQSDANIIQNLIIGNSSPQGGGLYWSVPSSDRGPLLVNNTIAGNDSADGSGIFGDGFQSQTTMVNNIIVGKSGEIAVFCGNFNNLTPPTFNFDDVFSTGTTYAGICTEQTGINGNISTDPLFADPTNSDYHLRVGSPAIDAGDNTVIPNLPSKDIDGDNRVINGIVDMGVDEYSIHQVLTVSTASLNFGLQAVGTSAVQSVIFTNNGAAAANISAVMAGGDFSQTNTCGTSLAAGANCTVSVTFGPTVRGLQNGVVAIMTDASESPQAVLLSGTGAAPVVSLSSASLSFSGLAINTTSPPKAVILTNTGDASLTFSSIVPSGDFAVTSTGTTCSTAAPVAAGANCSLNVTFTPTAIGARAGSLTITDNASGSPQIIQLTGQGLAGPPATIAVTSGTTQSAAINTAFASPLQATVKDAQGDPTSGVTVTFSVPARGASATFAGGVNTAVTNGVGLATSLPFTGNGVAGSYTVTATAGAVGPANFSLMNTATVQATIAASGGTLQTAVINTAFALPLQATVNDASGNPVGGVTVTFTVPGSGASGTFAGGVNTAVTNSRGVATSLTFTANGAAGGPYIVTASVAGVATPTSFSLANTTTAPAMIAATGGTPQSAAINTVFALPLQATVKDAGGNPVAGVTVTFTVIPGIRATGTFAGGLAMTTAVTNASGAATSAPFTASGITGSYTVTAKAGALGTSNFNLTNTAGTAATLTATSGTPQSAVINTAFALLLQAMVKDAGGNPVSGVTVTFAVSGSGASGTFAGGVNTAVTDANGVATSTTFTANGTGGSYTVTAMAGAAGPANFNLTNTTTAPAMIAATGGTPQSAAINTVFALPLQATVKDAGGNPVAGVTVTFTVIPGIRATATFAGGLAMTTAVTNASGAATSAPFTASGITGSYTVTAKAGAVGPASFNLTNTAAPPAFSPVMNFGTGGVTPIYVQSADVNGDGKLDLVVINQNSDTVAVLLGNGDGRFQPPATYDIASGGQSLPGCAAVADFNNDGRPDIAVTNGLIGTSGGTISILLNKGDGTFLPAVKVNSNTSPICLTSADLNADGNQDLWVGGNGSSAVLLGKGDGTFQAPQIYQIGLGDTQGVAVGDLNGDGLQDLLGVALTGGGPSSQPPSSVGVLLNQGNANFGPSPFGTVTLYPVGSLGATIVLGDFNHDGNLDAAVTNFGTNDISILLGNGDGTFKAQSRFLAGGGPFSLASADFDGTGRIDLVVTTQNAALNGNGVRVFLGNGDGTFRFYQGLATGSSPAYVTVGDFNGDGVPDIAVVDAATNVVSIILTQ
jgi:hypothetical protein